MLLNFNNLSGARPAADERALPAPHKDAGGEEAGLGQHLPQDQVGAPPASASASASHSMPRVPLLFHEGQSSPRSRVGDSAFVSKASPPDT